MTRLGVVFAVLALSVGAAGCAPRPPKAAEQVEALKQEETPDKLIDRAKAFAELGDNTRAEQYFSAAIDAGAEPHKVLPQLLKVCVAEKRYRVAIDYAEPELKKHPSDYKLRFVVASLYVTIGETKVARRELETITKDQPNHADAHFALGVIFRDDEKDPVQADEHFRQYLRIKPDGPHSEEARSSLLKTIEPRQPLKDVTPP